MATLTFIGYDLKQSLVNASSFFYLIIMPVGFYLLFGAIQDYGDLPLRDGNAAAYVMLGMAVYGAVQGAISSAGNAVIEIQSGWGRQLALTPLSREQLLISRVANAFVTTGLPVLCVNVTGRLTGAEIPWQQQLVCALVTVAAASIFVSYSVLIARLFKNARAVSVASGLVVFMSFFGTTFSPLPADLMPAARFSPMYGVTGLSRYAFTGGDIIIIDSTNWFVTEPLSYALLNVLAWGILFGVGSWVLRNRAQAR